MNGPSKQRFVICIHNGECPASLEVRKLYPVIPDPTAAEHHFLRIIDESGEDYLYPEAYFVPIELSQSIRDALATAA